jgi:hypothetical protein
MNRSLAACGVFEVDKGLFDPSFGEEMGLDAILSERSSAQDSNVFKGDVPRESHSPGQGGGILDEFQVLVLISDPVFIGS